MWTLLATGLLVVAAIVPVPATATPVTLVPPAVGVQTRTVVISYRAHDGRLRPALLLLPAGYHGQPIPLVISPHGRGQSAKANARFWGNLPAEGDFAVVNPGGQGRELREYSWGDPGEIDDLARMPAIVRRYGVNVEHGRVYAIGGSMGGQETLLLVARFPRLLAGAVAFDPATDMSRRYRDFASLTDGATLQSLARDEIGGTPETDPTAYERRSPDHYARAIADSGVPLQIFWSLRDRVIVDQRLESARLADRILDINPHARLWDFQGEWDHTAEMRSTRRLPRALARFGLLPWSKVPPLPRAATPPRATAA